MLGSQILFFFYRIKYKEIHSVWIWELACCTCTIAMHLFLGHSVYKCVLYWVCHGFYEKRKKPSVSLILSVYQNNQHFSIVSISVGGELGGIVVVLSHSHCTVESYGPLLLSSSPLAVWCSPSATEEISCGCTPDTRSGAGARRCVTCSPLSGCGFTVEDASLSARGSRLKGTCQKDAICRCLALIPLASGCAEGSAAAQHRRERSLVEAAFLVVR